MPVHPVARSMVIITGCVALFQTKQIAPILLMPAVLAMLVGSSLLLVVTGRGRRHRFDPFAATVAMACVAVVVTALQFGLQHGGGALGAALLVSLYVGFGGLAFSGSRWGTAGFLGLLLLHVLLTMADFGSYYPAIDVKQFLEGGLDALYSGVSPYGITIPNVFSAEETALFYGPSGVVEDGRVLYGYPYLPAPLLLDAVAHFAGEVRVMHLAALMGTAAIIRHLATDRTGRALSVLFLASPISRSLLNHYWVESLMALLLALAAWAMLRGRATSAGVALGLLLASKQYLVVVMPLAWTIWRSVGRRAVIVAIALAVLLILPFVLWDPQGFWRSAVQFQFSQPFRDDAMSLLPGVAEIFGPLPEWFLSGPSLVLGIGVSALVAWRTKAGPTALMLGIGLSMLCTVLLSKQAFTNYFGFIAAALVLAATTWTQDDPLDQTGAPKTETLRGTASQALR